MRKGENEFGEAARNGQIVDKDQVVNDLQIMSSLYKTLGITGQCINRIVGQFGGEFYSADRIGQCRVASKIHMVVQRLSQASDVFQRHQ